MFWKKYKNYFRFCLKFWVNHNKVRSSIKINGGLRILECIILKKGLIIIRGLTRKTLFNFICLFIFINIISFGIDYFFRPPNFHLINQICVAFGVSFGLIFGELLFSKNKK